MYIYNFEKVTLLLDFNFVRFSVYFLHLLSRLLDYLQCVTSVSCLAALVGAAFQCLFQQCNDTTLTFLITRTSAPSERAWPEVI